MTTWRFLTNHGLVYLHKVQNPDSTVREIAFDLGVTERAVHRILRDLERDGYLLKERVGRRAYYRATSQQMTLRHQPMLNVDVKQLIGALTGGRYPEQETAPPPMAMIHPAVPASPSRDGVPALSASLAAPAEKALEQVGQAAARP